jgi:hypothetical protein
VRNYRQLSTLQRFGLLGASSVLFAFPWGACNLGQITTTSTVTLDTRSVVVQLIQAAIITPLQTIINDRVNDFFDELEGKN